MAGTDARKDRSPCVRTRRAPQGTAETVQTAQIAAAIPPVTPVWSATLTMPQIAARIDVWLKQFEADIAIGGLNDCHKPAERPGGTRPYYGAHCHFYGGNRIAIRYVSYQHTTQLTKAEALQYLAALAAGYRGKHFQVLREIPR